jgi:hypothetical protein
MFLIGHSVLSALAPVRSSKPSYFERVIQYLHSYLILVLLGSLTDLQDALTPLTSRIKSDIIDVPHRVFCLTWSGDIT